MNKTLLGIMLETTLANTLFKINLRGKYGFDDVVCTDWKITADAPVACIHAGKSCRVESLSVTEDIIWLLWQELIHCINFNCD